MLLLDLRQRSRETTRTMIIYLADHVARRRRTAKALNTRIASASVSYGTLAHYGVSKVQGSAESTETTALTDLATALPAPALARLFAEASLI
jgi:hypothetical protein